MLAEHFIRLGNSKFRRQMEGLTPDALGMLMNYDWPGNVRVQNYIERAIVLSDEIVLGPSCFPPQITHQDRSEGATPVDTEDRSLKDVRTLLDAWDAGSLPLSGWDKGLLKRALKAYRKRLKILRLDDMSSSTHSPLSKGGMSAIQGIKPPEQYPQEVWNLLVAQDRLRDAGNGLLELGIT